MKEVLTYLGAWLYLIIFSLFNITLRTVVCFYLLNAGGVNIEFWQTFVIVTAYEVVTKLNLRYESYDTND